MNAVRTNWWLSVRSIKTIYVRSDYAMLCLHSVLFLIWVVIVEIRLLKIKYVVTTCSTPHCFFSLFYFCYFFTWLMFYDFLCVLCRGRVGRVTSSRMARKGYQLHQLKLWLLILGGNYYSGIEFFLSDGKSIESSLKSLNWQKLTLKGLMFSWLASCTSRDRKCGSNFMQEPVKSTSNVKQRKPRKPKHWSQGKWYSIDKTRKSFSDYTLISVGTIEKQAVSENFEGKWKPHVQAIQWMIWQRQVDFFSMDHRRSE